MKAVSLFSGVGGLDLGFERAGIETVLQVEQEPWALEVLARHWPGTERVTDVRAVGMGDGAGNERRESTEPQAGALTDAGADGERDADVGDRGLPGEAERRPGGGARDLAGADVHLASERSRARGGIDLIYGGFPCQDLSVAGKRAGLGGDRSGLWFEFRRVLSELRPRWAVIENVPGLLSSNGGADFAVLLNGLEELGFWWAYGVLDSQHFGVPQRRRRVFVVAGPSRRGAEQVLSLCESCGGNPETGGEAGEDVAGTLGGGAGDRGWSPDTDRMTFVPIEDVGRKMSGGPEVGLGVGQDGDPMYTLGAGSRHGVGVIAPTLDTHLGDKRWLENQSVGNYGLMERAGEGVRRLTPVECERLQGFPDDWTRYTADGREIADSHRYRMMGNAVTVPVAEWIGHRLVAVDSMLRSAA